MSVDGKCGSVGRRRFGPKPHFGLSQAATTSSPELMLPLEHHDKLPSLSTRRDIEDHFNTFAAVS